MGFCFGTALALIGFFRMDRLHLAVVILGKFFDDLINFFSDYWRNGERFFVLDEHCASDHPTVSYRNPLHCIWLPSFIPVLPSV